MDPNKKASEPNYAKLHQALNSFNQPSDLALSDLAQSCLVKRHLAEYSGTSSSETLREILVDLTNLLDEINPDYADIIRGRFFEGLTVGEMLTLNRPKPMAERTFKKHQRKAIIELASLFSQREDICRIENQGQLPLPSEEERTSNKGLIVAVGSLLLVLLFAIFRIFPLTTVKPSLCGESTLLEDSPVNPRFLYPEGVTAYTAENTPNQVLHDRVRTVFGTEKGVLLGYFDQTTQENGLSYFDRSGETKVWANCNDSGITQNARVNSILVDDEGGIWVATDGEGVFHFNGKKWQQFTPQDSGLPSASAFELTTDPDGQVWVGTTDGVATFMEGEWQIRFKDELFHNQVYSLAFDQAGNIWVGHIFMGISYFDNAEGNWQWYQDSTGQLSSNNIRGIVLRPETQGGESVWIATDGGGLSVFHRGEWRTIGLEDGLPSLHINDIEKDRYNRVWVATDQGVFYYDGERWVPYNHLFTHSIAFSPGCADNACPEDDHVWTGTETNGLTHSRLPYPQDTVQINRICFVDQENNLTCPAFNKDDAANTITAAYPGTLSPGESFYFEVHVTPINGYQLVLDATRGDSLNFIGADETGLYGAYIKIPADGVTAAGETFVFSNRNDHILAPELPTGTAQQTLTLPWRIWMHTRYTGPTIQIEFMVTP